MNSLDPSKMVVHAIRESIQVKEQLLQSLVPEIVQAAEEIVRSINTGGKLILFGNGGSASDAQHIAAELVGRFEQERRPFAAIALTTNTSNLTAIGNDYGFDKVFSRQVEALAGPEDVVLGISTSGNSLNVLEAIRSASAKGLKTIGLTGEKGGHLASECAICLKVPSANTARIQESHIMIGHILCLLVEQKLS